MYQLHLGFTVNIRREAPLIRRPLTHPGAMQKETESAVYNSELSLHLLETKTRAGLS